MGAQRRIRWLLNAGEEPRRPQKESLRNRDHTPGGEPQAQEEKKEEGRSGRRRRLTCRLVSCCCWCAMVCFTSTLLMLCSMAYFLA